MALDLDKHTAAVITILTELEVYFSNVARSSGMAGECTRFKQRVMSRYGVAKNSVYYVRLSSIIKKARKCSYKDLGSGHGIKPLASVFARLQISDEKLVPPMKYYGFREFNPENSFPGDISSLNAKSLDIHLAGFKQEVQRIQSKMDGMDSYALYTHLMALVQKYGWCLPVNVEDEYADISLYDHIKVTSAVACALNPSGTGQSNQDELMVAAGDLSGIQKYIFEISHERLGGIGKRLRARSFTLGIITDILSHKLVHEFDVILSNVIISSGGKFYILISNTAENREKIVRLQEELDNEFIKKFNGEVVINLALTSFGLDEFDDFGRVIYRVNQELNIRKNRALSGALAAQGEWREDRFVIDCGVTGEGDLCTGCRKLKADVDYRLGDTVIRICSHCAENLSIGKELTNARYIAFYNDEQHHKALKGMSFALLNDRKLISGEPVIVYKLNDTNLSDLYDFPAQFKFLANYVPKGQNQEVLTFEDISKKSMGKPMLGYFKADIDNLGSLFVMGLRGDKINLTNISRITFMSRMLDMFFSGWVNNLLMSNYKNTYSVFSGGDDLFMLSPWNESIEIAQKINREFGNFTCSNKNITLSAGIAITKWSYPIARSAEMAEESVDRSKKHNPDMDEPKDQITIFNDTIKWDRLKDIMDETQRVVQWFDEGKLTSSILNKIVGYHLMYRDYYLSGESKSSNLRYIPMLTYEIIRNFSRGKDNDLLIWLESLKRKDSLSMRYMNIIYSYIMLRKAGI